MSRECLFEKSLKIEITKCTYVHEYDRSTTEVIQTDHHIELILFEFHLLLQSISHRLYPLAIQHPALSQGPTGQNTRHSVFCKIEENFCFVYVFIYILDKLINIGVTSLRYSPSNSLKRHLKSY